MKVKELTLRVNATPVIARKDLKINQWRRTSIAIKSTATLNFIIQLESQKVACRFIINREFQVLDFKIIAKS